MAPFFISLLLLLLVSFFQFSSTQPLCREFERLALEQFKNNFLIDENASGDSLAYSKVDRWKSQGNDCCLWEGITCDQHTGRVIGVELNSSYLFGSINSSSTLFNLGHLQYLNLADNNFNYSSIPPAFGNLSRLSYLNLSESWFSGQVPFDISKLSKLTNLDLSWNIDSSTKQGLELRVQDFKSLIHNLTRLEYLCLSSVNINSSVPHRLANFSSLTYLGLSQCGLFGEFPNAIFQLPKLENLYVHDNLGLTGILPEFHFSNPLKKLNVSDTSFSGEIPKSFGLLSSLESLIAKKCNFSGFLPPSLLNITKLHTISLRSNSFEGSMVSFFPNLTQLDLVDLSSNLFTFTEIPSLARSTNLRILDLSYNQISGPFPSWLTNLTQLTDLDLGHNMIQGTLLSSISRLKNLEKFSVGFNELTGTLELETFLRLQHLESLSLSGNSFSIVTKNTTSTNNTRLPKFVILQLSSCNLKEFPAFLRNQDQLQVLVLQSNNIHGQIPKWLLEMSSNLLLLSLANNSLTGFEKSYNTLPPSLLFLILDFNLLRGSLPIPPHSISIYIVSSNQFNGEIPLEFCNMTSLQWLDLSGNNLSGIIPQCLGNRNTRLSNLNLGQNNLRGELPRPLANCKDLESLDVSDNQIRDTFPSWLGLLPHLKIIILRFNRLYGEIDGPKPDSMFPELRIVDLSHNEFLGPLPLKYFLQWNVMANIHDDNKATYLDADYGSNKMTFSGLHYTMTITNKGNKMSYGAILNIFAAIDLSSNKFSGGILETVGNLRKLELLNLSNNVLVGPIPPALGNLSKLEALDLSSNKLSGRIPTELTQLNFLEVFDVSNNLLTGPIPRGSQFDTFENSSFQGNPELCGMPLSKKCGNHAPPLPSSSEENGHISFLSEIGWKAVLIGCGCGFLGGVVLGVKVFARKQEWFMTTFRIKQGRRSGFRRS